MEALMTPTGLRLPTPQVVLHYAGRDVSAQVAPCLLEFSYTDYLQGQSDGLDVTMEDTQQRWQSAWYPQHGDVLQAQVGYAGAPLLPCGTFEVDEVQLQGPPDVVRIRALAAGVKRSVRTRNGRAYEDTTLADVARAVAQRNRLQLRGTIEPIPIARVTQVFETDLAFLLRVAQSYGYAFSVRGNQLCFFRRAQLKAAEAVLVIHRQDVVRYDFCDKVRGVAAAAVLAYHDPAACQVQQALVQDVQAQGNQHGSDILKINDRAENAQQARIKAEAALDRANEDQTGATLDLPGQPRLVAGVNVRLHGFGRMDGKYTVTQARHAVQRGTGYTTQVQLKRVRDPAQGAAA